MEKSGNPAVKARRTMAAMGRCDGDGDVERCGATTVLDCGVTRRWGDRHGLVSCCAARP